MAALVVLDQFAARLPAGNAGLYPFVFQPEGANVAPNTLLLKEPDGMGLTPNPLHLSY